MTRCRSCGQELVSNRTLSPDSPGYCRDCGDLVYALRPDRQEPDDWYFVMAEKPIGGEVVLAGQCEGCGLSEFLIEPESLHSFVGVCDGQEWDDEWLDGCGMRHLVRMKKRCEVIQ